MAVKGKRNVKGARNEPAIKSKKRKIDKSKHADLVEKGKKWLRGQKGKNWGCPIVFGELVTATSETPDVMGLSSVNTTIIECKTSRSDFLRDKKKMSRTLPQTGMGRFRLYMCPTDLIKVEELPDGWGLIYVSEGGRSTLIEKPKGQSCNLRHEHTYMYSIIRRMCTGTNKEIKTFLRKYT